MRRSPPKATMEDLPRPVLPQPNAAFKSSAPAVVVQCWCGLVQWMDRRTLDRFTRETWKSSTLARGPAERYGGWPHRARRDTMRNGTALATILATALVTSALTACAGDQPAPTGPGAGALSLDRGGQGGAPGDGSVPLTLDPHASAACGFDVLVQYDGKIKTLNLPGGRVIQIFPQFTATFVNGATGAAVTLNATGVLHVNPLPDGNVELVFTGNNFTVQNDAVFQWLRGRFTVVLDAQGQEVRGFDGVGDRVDVCALLRG
jgi:hypothetical protein